MTQTNQKLELSDEGRTRLANLSASGTRIGGKIAIKIKEARGIKEFVPACSFSINASGTRKVSCYDLFRV